MICNEMRGTAVELWMQEAEREVSREEGVAMARQHGSLFLECSAKTKINVQQCFQELVQKVWGGR